MENQPKENIKEQVMQQIDTGSIVMKSRWYFVLKSCAFLAGTVLVLGSLVYIASFIAFTLRINGILALPSFGLPGIFILFSSLPWILLLVAVILLVVLEILSHHVSFMYRTPLVYSVLILTFVVGAIGFLIDKTPLHPRLLEYTTTRPVLGVSPLYERFGKPPHRSVGAGMVVSISETGLVIENIRGETLQIATSSHTRFPRGLNIQPGDHVVILGEKKEGQPVIEARGIRVFDPKLQDKLPKHLQKKVEFNHSVK